MRNNNLSFLPKNKALSADDSDALDRWGRHPSFQRMETSDPLEPFRRYRQLIREHGKTSLQVLNQQEMLVLSNMRLVFKVARHYANRGVPVADLIQEGFLGLSVVVEKFKPELGYQFSTYASWWIRSYINRAVMDQTTFRAMRVPINHQEHERHILREEARFVHVFGKTPDDEELLAFIRGADAKIDANSVKKLRLLRQSPLAGISVSIDAPSHAEDDRTLVDRLPAGGSTPELIALARQHLPRLQREIDEIADAAGEGNSSRNSAIFRMRYGLRPYSEPSTLQEVGRVFGLTRERVRQITARRLKDFALSESEFKQMVENLNTVREAIDASG